MELDLSTRLMVNLANAIRLSFMIALIMPVDALISILISIKQQKFAFLALML